MWIHGKGQLRAACSEDKAEEAPAVLARRRPILSATVAKTDARRLRQTVATTWALSRSDRPAGQCQPVGIVSPDAHITLLARCRMGLASELRLVIGAVSG
jgi:hypothetical protein